MSTAPVFFAPRPSLLAGDVVRLDGPEGRHAVSVRRLTVGEDVALTDGAGLLVTGVVSATEGKDVLHATVVDRVELPPAAPRFTVVQALPKGDRGELAVELLTEVGVDVVVPWSAQRCVARWKGDRGQKALQRWRSAAYAAAKQARRPWFPEVTELADTPEVCRRLATADLAVALHEAAETSVRELDLGGAVDVVLVVGPEGGISPEELAAMHEVGAVELRTGPTVLRTSTAGTVALGALLSRTSRWT